MNKLIAILSLVLVLCTLSLMLMMNQVKKELIASNRMPLGEKQRQEVSTALHAEWDRHEMFLRQELKYSQAQCEEAKQAWLMWRICEALSRLEHQ